MVYAGGMQNNTNQSAEYVRTLNRTASTDVDAVFSNPAGLAKLDDGMYLYLSNQSALQTRTIVNDYAYLNTGTYEGATNAYLYPNFYFAWKSGKLALSGGFEPIGGGGSAEFDKGLPSFEMPISELVPALSAGGVPVTDYRANISFTGSSTYLGGQAGATYAINDMLALYVGGRYVSAGNTYEGYLKDIEIKNAAGAGQWMRADAFFNGAAAQYTAAASSLTTASDGLTAAIAGGYPTTTPVTSVDADGSLATGLAAIGYDAATLDIGTAQAIFAGAAASATTNAAVYTAKAEAVGDMEVDVAQNGSGFTGIVGLNVSLDKLNIGMRYETATSLELANETKKDDTGLFPNGRKFHSDIPAMFLAGVSYKATDAIKVEGSFHYYFDKSADYGYTDANGAAVSNADALDANSMEYGISAEYKLSDALLVSGGYLGATSGRKAAFQSDMSYSLNSNSVAVGFGYHLNPAMMLNVGYTMTMYADYDNSYTFTDSALPGTPTVNETYSKTSNLFGIGLSYKLK